MINWFPTKERVHQFINVLTFKFLKNNFPFYLNEIFEFTPHCRKDTRNNFTKLIARLTRGRKRFVKQSTKTY